MKLKPLWIALGVVLVVLAGVVTYSVWQANVRHAQRVRDGCAYVSAVSHVPTRMVDGKCYIQNFSGQWSELPNVDHAQDGQ